MFRSLCLGLLPSAFLAIQAAAADWSQFRGPDTTNSTANDRLPTDWSVETGEGIAWEANLPGHGVSTPIVVGGKVIVTAASEPDEQQLHVLAIDLATGAELWQRRFWATGRTQIHQASSVAANTPASDSKRVFALFSSNDLVAFDTDGNLLWMRALAVEHPKLGNDVGMGSSPLFVPTASGGAVVVQCESQGAAFLEAFDPRTGATLWEVDRPREGNWSTPVVLDGNVLVQSRTSLALYGAADGALLWEQPADCQTIPSPTIVGGTLLAPAGGVLALNATSSVPPEPLWTAGRVKPSAASVAVSGDQLYAVARGGVMTAASLLTGEPLWKRRLGGTCWATPLATPSRVYCANQDGEVFVVAAEDGKILAEHKMGAKIMGSPVPVGDALLLRSDEKLWKIGPSE